MPHPKNHLKLTGDTHSPDVVFDLDDRDDIDDPAVRYDDGYEPAAARTSAAPERAESAPSTGVVEAATAGARAKVGRNPLMMAGLALVAGFAVMRMVRR